MNRPPQGWVAWWHSRSLEVCAEVIRRAEIQRYLTLEPQAPPAAAAPVRQRTRKPKRRVKRKARR